MRPEDDAPSPAEPGSGERRISPISGRLPGWKGKVVPLTALALGSGVLLFAGWRSARPPQSGVALVEATSTRPVFEAARRPTNPSIDDTSGAPEPPVDTDVVIPPLEPSRPSPSVQSSSSEGVAARQSLLVFSHRSASPGREGSELRSPTEVAGSADATHAFRIGPGTLHLREGQVVSCVLQTAIDSSTPGPVGCTLPRDVFSDDGTVVVLPRGTQVRGEYRTSLRQGRRRLHVLWTRLTTPEGVVVDLDAPAGDPLGRVGLDGRVETRFWGRLGDALLHSLVEEGTTRARRSRTDLAGLDLDAGHETGNEALLHRAQGTEVSILVARDIDFSSVFRLRVR